MTRFSKITILTICISLTPLAPVMADADTTAVMEELFATFWSSAGEANVGSKDDAGRSTRWNDVTFESPEDGPKFVLPWVEVSKKLLGGYAVTMADEIAIAGDLPDGKKMDGVFTTQGLSMEIGGKAGARSYDMAFDQVKATMNAGDLFEMTLQMNDGNSQSILANDIMTGTFEYPKFDLEYELNIEGQDMSVKMSMADIAGNYRAPVIGGRDVESYQKFWSGDELFFTDYAISGMEMQTNAVSPAGPVSVGFTGGAGKGRVAADKGVVSISGDSKDLKYIVSAMGMPPMSVSIDSVSQFIAVPLDNVEQTKTASIQMALMGLELDPAIWGMFDAKGLLPRDKANLEIDLSADVKWSQKIADIDVTQMATGLPVEFSDVKITALNLNALGAEVKTDGSFNVDSSSFPPAASGTANVSVKGVDALMGKLTEAGLLPVQNAMMAKGMMSVFFKQGGEGIDHLTSQIMISPDGSISANGVPLK